MSSFYDDASLVVIPSGYKTSKVYAEKPTDGSGDLTFTRTGDTATRVNSAGLIEKVRTNRVTYSQDFSNAAWLIGSGQTKTQGQTDPNGGTTAVLISNVSEANGYLSQAITLTANVPNTFSIYIKGSSSGSVSIRLDDSGAGPQFDINYTTSWQRFSVTKTVDQSGCFLTIGGYSTWAIGENIQFAFAQVETGDIATAYIPTTTAAVSVGPVANVPRLDYLGSTCPRLLLEPQRTNLYTFSEQLNQWTASSATVTANYAVSPDGYTNADRVQFSAGGLLYIGGTGSAGENTLSVYAKATNGTSAKFRFFGNGNTTFSSDQTATGEWQRFTFTYTYSAATAGLKVATTGADDVIFYGFQHEIAAYPTSYIPTLAASATRGADACSKTGISSLIGQTEGTLFGEIEVSQNGFWYLSLSSGSNTNWVFVGQDLSGSNRIRGYVRSGGVVYADIAGGSIANGRHKIAISYKLNDVVLYVDGVLIGSDTSATMPVGLSDFYISAAGATGGDQTVTGALNQALVFKTRLTNAELAELTTL